MTKDEIIKKNLGFEELKEMVQKGVIPNSYRYDVEMDYLEWEGLASRGNDKM